MQTSHIFSKGESPLIWLFILLLPPSLTHLGSVHTDKAFHWGVIIFLDVGPDDQIALRVPNDIEPMHDCT